LNLPVAAEGIEDKRIEERLRALGCGFGQGYLYGRPVNAANARSLLAERRLIQAAPSPEMPLPTDMRQAS
jgi:EAL domain-containing protein (putative c-di-GMP-specific phosphodiesterase class I)